MWWQNGNTNYAVRAWRPYQYNSDSTSWKLGDNGNREGEEIKLGEPIAFDVNYEDAGSNMEKYALPCIILTGIQELFQD